MWRSNRLFMQKFASLLTSSQPWRCCGSAQRVLAIRREDNSDWERRAPLSPTHVRELVKNGVKVIVQLSNRRAYPMQDYVNAGATVQEDISEAPVIVGVKQVPIDLLEPNKTYAFFSHTIKAQEANMPLLDAILEKNIRLIDYEKLVDEKGQRLVAFGKYAGVAGMINILHGLGLRLLALGHHTPFMHIGPAHNYRNSVSARQAIRDAGYEVALGLMPKSIGPLTFIFTGAGNVSLGAQEVFRELPHEYVSPDNLPEVAVHGSTDRLYSCVIDMQDNLVRKTDGQFDVQEYFQYPERYASTFSVRIAPYASVIINGIYWAPGAPRFITLPDAKHLIQSRPTPWIASSEGCPKLPHRLLSICDISADPGGSIEFVKECTTINKPFQLYDADQNSESETFQGAGILVCSIDNMPAQLPLEATDFFGGLLMPHIYDMLKSDATKPFEDFKTSPVVKNAVIASNGELTPNFEYISEMRKTRREMSSARMAAAKAERKVLILGAGYVSAPVVDYLARDSNFQVTVASEFKAEIDKLHCKFPCITPELLEIHRSQDELEKLISSHDLVISLLPYSLHPDVAKLCIKLKTNMVTASYRSPAMLELHNAAMDAGITILNEVGVDPGIDHMLALECFDEIKAHGGKVTSFISWCGGVPAPEDADNPLRYKFSWSPRGVLLNTMSDAKYLQDGEVREISPNGGLLDHVQNMDFLPGFNLEGIPNRDSTVYSDLYGIHSAHTILRGTLRYKGFCDAMKGILSLGLIDPKEHPLLHPSGPDITWRELMCDLFGQKRDIFIDTLKDLVLEKVGGVESRRQAIVDLGLLEDEVIVKRGSLLDSLSDYLAKTLNYEPDERDLIIMRHEVGVQWPDRSEEVREIELVVYGNPKKYSAMASTVGYPTGIAAKMILQGEIQDKGVILPFGIDVYRPILQRLQQEGIRARENVVTTRQAHPKGEENIRL